MFRRSQFIYSEIIIFRKYHIIQFHTHIHVKASNLVQGISNDNNQQNFTDKDILHSVHNYFVTLKLSPK